VETALSFTLQLMVEKQGVRKVQDVLKSGLNITIVGDNDFYSQRPQVSLKEVTTVGY
jgi:phosphomevalonate kinase